MQLPAFRQWFPWVFYPFQAAMAAGLVCWFVATNLAGWPPYETKATLLIDETADGEAIGASSEGIAIAQRTVAALVVREPLRTEAAERADVGIDSEELVEHLRVHAPDGAPIVELVVTHPDPEDAVTIANAFAIAVSYTHLTLPTTPYV